jgi:hypothetical protein
MFTIFSSASDNFPIFSVFTLPNVKMNYTSESPKDGELDARLPLLEWLTFIAEQVESANLQPNQR